jgi:hypothetical protein
MSLTLFIIEVIASSVMVPVIIMVVSNLFTSSSEQE